MTNCLKLKYIQLICSYLNI